jgi:hypothetical protein
MVALAGFADRSTVMAQPPNSTKGGSPTAPSADGESAKAKPGLAPPAAPEIEVDPYLWLDQSAPFLRPAKPEELVSLISELNGRGQADAARLLSADLRLTDDDFARLSRTLMARGLFRATDALINNWQRQFPGSTNAPLHLVTLRLILGEAELAERDLVRLRNVPPARQPMVRLLTDFVRATRRRQALDAETNPWEIRFLGADGVIPVGTIDPAERPKITPERLSALLELLTFAPTNGSWWALAGLMLNGIGKVDPAEECLRRARAMNHAPKSVFLLTSAIERRKAERQLAATAAIGAPSGPAATSAKTPADDGARNNPGEFRLWTVIIGLSMLTGGLIAVQLMQWFGRRTRSGLRSA